MLIDFSFYCVVCYSCGNFFFFFGVPASWHGMVWQDCNHRYTMNGAYTSISILYFINFISICVLIPFVSGALAALRFKHLIYCIPFNCMSAPALSAKAYPKKWKLIEAYHEKPNCLRRTEMPFLFLDTLALARLLLLYHSHCTLHMTSISLLVAIAQFCAIASTSLANRGRGGSELYTFTCLIYLLPQMFNRTNDL